MSGDGTEAPGRVIRVTTDSPGLTARVLWALAVGDDERALARFKEAFPDRGAEIVGNLSQESLKDLGLTKPGLMVPLS